MCRLCTERLCAEALCTEPYVLGPLYELGPLYVGPRDRSMY